MTEIAPGEKKQTLKYLCSGLHVGPSLDPRSVKIGSGFLLQTFNRNLPITSELLSIFKIHPDCGSTSVTFISWAESYSHETFQKEPSISVSLLPCLIRIQTGSESLPELMFLDVRPIYKSCPVIFE